MFEEVSVLIPPIVMQAMFVGSILHKQFLGSAKKRLKGFGSYNQLHSSKHER